MGGKDNLLSYDSPYYKERELAFPIIAGIGVFPFSPSTLHKYGYPHTLSPPPYFPWRTAI